ncbi:uncharacterized protein C01G6.5-like isoform X2 [Asterias rubens]|uniref:uncharacterized protein C01G6.5-like isoform X2 n=1 Tax=Asterias rubens TaxID=7604 RepID=UPI001454E58B|nr:uncharacterized protein C01G6.5-like isoform X2 [Asterias rubens]
MDDSGELTENCLYQLRRIGAAATCKGIEDVFLLNKQKLTIGRHIAMVDVYLNSSIHKQLISRQHAVVTSEYHNNRQMVYVQDMSTNGTFINDVKIAGRVRINEGDTLTFGHTSGVKLMPGMLSRQIHSEFRFVFEKVLSENAIQTDELKVPSVFVSRHPLTTTYSLPRDQHSSPPGLDTAVLSDIAVVPKSNSENRIHIFSTPSRIPSLQPNSNLESSALSTPTNFGTPQSPTPRDHQTPSTKSKQSTNFHLQSTSSLHVSPEMPRIQSMNPSLNSLPGTHSSKHFTTTPAASSLRGDRAPGEATGNYISKEVRSPERKDKHGLRSSEEDKRTASNLDDELFRLTSVVRAKAEHFDSSASEQELDPLPQRFQFGNTNFLAPKTSKNSSQTRWTSSTPCQDLHPSRSSSSVVSSQTPLRSTLSSLDQEKVTRTSSLADSISTEPRSTSPIQTSKKKKSINDSEEIQSKKRGPSSIETAKKKGSKKHHHRRSKTKIPPPVKLSLGPPAKLPIGAQNEAQMPDVEFEVCDSYDCCRPTDNTLAWVQCDSCDSWYHVTCVGCDYDSVRKDSASFHCGCSK